MPRRVADKPAPAPPAAAPPAAARLATALAWAFATLPPLAAYLLTLHPGLPAGDSGELITAAATAGSAHPPGYPLWVMLAWGWQRALPFGSVAWRLNLFSAVTMALAAGVLAAAVQRLARSRVAGVLAGWAFAIAVPVWTNAIVAEVFALHALLAACALRALAELAATAGEPARPRVALLVLTFLAVLAFSHHHTLLLLALPAVFTALAAAWREAAGRRVALATQAAALKLLALTPLLWLPWAAHRAGALHWGDAGTLRGFAVLLLRAEYGTFRLDPAQVGLHAGGSHLVRFVQSLPAVFGWLPLLLAAVGAVVLVRRARAVALALAACAALQAWFYTRVGFPTDDALLRGVVARFDILPLLLLALLAGMGAAAALSLVRGRERAALACTLALVVALPAWPRGRAVDQRGNAFTETLGRGILASLPAHAVVFVQGDLLHNALAYANDVERLRPDVTVVDQELLAYGWYVRDLRARAPGLLPPLGRAQRITLRGGRELEGIAIARADGSVDVITESGQGTMPAANVLRVVEAPPESLYLATRAGFDAQWPLRLVEDRYSGLPGTRNLLWLDRLLPRRPVAFVGVKDASFALRDTLTPVGFVAWATPRGAEPSVAAQAAATLAVLDGVALDPYFRAYPPESFEAAERRRLAAMATRAALVLSQPDAAAPARAHPAGHARLLAFAERFERLDPTPDPRCLRAIGFLRVLDESFRDLGAARRDLERYVASGDSSAARDRDAQLMLARLPAGDR
jgi:hypothetical protein